MIDRDAAQFAVAWLLGGDERFGDGLPVLCRRGRDDGGEAERYEQPANHLVPQLTVHVLLQDRSSLGGLAHIDAPSNRVQSQQFNCTRAPNRQASYNLATHCDIIQVTALISHSRM